MTTLIIVRHAQSIANEKGIFIGHKDMDLSDLGHFQAKLLCDYLLKKEYKIDAIYSSDLLRPFHTVEPYAKAIGKEIIKNSNLREIFAGKWEGHKFADLYDLFPENYGAWKTDIGSCKCDGGESVKELYERINLEIDRIADRHDGETVLIGTHATPLRCIMARCEGVGVAGMKDIKWCENTSLNIFEYSEGVLSPVALNVSEHLSAYRSGLPSSV